MSRFASALALSLLVMSRTAPAEVPVYDALRAVRPESAGLAVKDLVLVRDVITLKLTGTVHLLPSVADRTVGAVFLGSGSYELSPATATEREHLALVTGQKQLAVLSDRFDSAVLLFTDGTTDELREKGTPAPAGTAEKALRAFDAHLKRQRKEYHTNFHLRLLPDVLDGTSGTSGAFYAFVEGDKLPGGVLALDPRGIESSGLGSQLAGETVTFFANHKERGGFWYLSHRKGDLESGRAASRPVDALRYTIDTRIKKSADVVGTTTLELKALVDGTRVLPIRISPRLRIEEVHAGRQGAPPSALPFVQEARDDDADAALVFPSPLKAGETVTLTFRYSGDDVLENAGDGNYYVRARQSWYPNVGDFDDPATFDLTYRVPKKYEVVSVGALVESRVEEDAAVSRWKVEKPIRIAGFNYGKFKRLEQKDETSGMTVRVYTNPGKPSFARELEEAVDLARFDTTKLAQSALADGINTARTGDHFFGRLTTTDVAITHQTEWSFGQSWPSLIFLPYMAFLNSTTRLQLGLLGASSFVEEVGPHEFAHQWWGHEVGWASYHDQWLSEGLAEFSSGLVLNQTAGFGRYLTFFENARSKILSRSAGGYTPNEAGPISLGWRLATEKTPDAYGAVVYSKGALVVHMLRMAMKDPRAEDPDARFRAAMKDFVTSFSGKSPTTDDFRKVLERHITPSLNPTGDGTLRWFFDQWVHGTEIPRLKHDVKVTEGTDGKYRVSGPITQSEVSPGFISQIPLYAEFEKGQLVRFGTIALVGSTTSQVNGELAFPKKPKRIVPNALLDVLTRN